MLENRHFVFLSAVADIAKKMLNAVGDGVNFFNFSCLGPFNILV